MALTPAQRKKLLGFGGLTRAGEIAGKKAGREEQAFTIGHMSQVNSEIKSDPTGVARAAITQVIRENLAKAGLTLLEHDDIWPAQEPDRDVAAIVAGAKR